MDSQPCVASCGPDDTLPRCLPDDVWEVVSDLLQTTTLSYVCSHLRRLLVYRYVRCTVSQRDIENKLTLLAAILRHVRYLKLDCINLRDEDFGALAMLTQAPGLRGLTINSAGVRLRFGLLQEQRNDFGRCGAPVIMALRHLPQLQVLTLHLQENSATRELVASLAELGHLSSLRSLVLNLSSNYLSDEVAEGLGALSAIPMLEVLHVALRHVPLGDRCALALAKFSTMPRLRSLTLALPYTHITDAGVEALAAVRRCPALTELSLHLAGCGVGLGNASAKALALLGDCPTLQVLSVDLWRNDVGPSGTAALATLKRSKSLRRLSLDLAFNPLGRHGAEALRGLHESSSLQSLQVDLRRCLIVDWDPRRLTVAPFRCTVAV